MQYFGQHLTVLSVTGRIFEVEFSYFFQNSYYDSSYPFSGSLLDNDGFTFIKTQDNIEQCVLMGFYKEPQNTILILERGYIYNGSRKTAQTYDHEYTKPANIYYSYNKLLHYKKINDPNYQSWFSPLFGIITQGISNKTLLLASQKTEFSELGDKDKDWDLIFLIGQSLFECSGLEN